MRALGIWEKDCLYPELAHSSLNRAGVLYVVKEGDGGIEYHPKTISQDFTLLHHGNLGGLTVPNSPPELCQIVQAYVQGEISRTELENWIVPRLQELLDPKSRVQDLVAEIELGLAEFSHGDVSEEELKRGLSEFLEKDASIFR